MHTSTDIRTQLQNDHRGQLCNVLVLKHNYILWYIMYITVILFSNLLMEMTVTYRNYIHEEIKNKLNSGCVKVC
jgi:hypothetical protein